MRKAFALCICLFILLVSCERQKVRSTAPTQASNPGVVRELIIAGNRRIPTDTIKANIHTRAGAPLNMATLKADIERLESSGEFDNVSLTEETQGNGDHILTIDVKETVRPKER